MSKLDELKVKATKVGIEWDSSWHTVDFMDALRAKIGTFDPDLQIDPAKAQDLNKKIDWMATDPFAGISAYLTPLWLLEPKMDGVRFRFFVGKLANSMNTGRRSTVTYAYIEQADKFPHLRDTVIPEFAGTILDCELMPAVNRMMTGIRKGKEEWTQGPLNTIMAIVGSEPAKAIARQEEWGKAILIVFDVLAVKGESVMDQTLLQRRKMLEPIMEEFNARCPQFQIVEQLEASIPNILVCLENGFEGVVLKRKGGKYIPGKRLADWQKVKRMSSGDFFIIGSVDGKGKHLGKVGSLKVAYRSNDGVPRFKELTAEEHAFAESLHGMYCADAAGFTDALRNDITGPDGKVKEKYLGQVIEVMAQGKTKMNRLRHPRFIRFRPDKDAAQCEPAASIDLFQET